MPRKLDQGAVQGGGRGMGKEADTETTEIRAGHRPGKSTEGQQQKEGEGPRLGLASEGEVGNEGVCPEIGSQQEELEAEGGGRSDSQHYLVRCRTCRDLLSTKLPSAPGLTLSSRLG